MKRHDCDGYKGLYRLSGMHNFQSLVLNIYEHAEADKLKSYLKCTTQNLFKITENDIPMLKILPILT